MVETKTQTEIQPSKPVNPRDKIREARQRRLRLVQSDRPKTVKVFAANESLREVLRHPSGKIRFRDTIDQGVEWPNDSFTARRIADGSVRTDGPGSGDPVPADEKLNPRQQSAARKAKDTKETKDAKENGKEGSKDAAKPAPAAKSQPQPAT